jgi:hypothetical protein
MAASFRQVLQIRARKSGRGPGNLFKSTSSPSGLSFAVDQEDFFSSADIRLPDRDLPVKTART